MAVADEVRALRRAGAIGLPIGDGTTWEQHLGEALEQAQPTEASFERCPRVSRPATGMGSRCIRRAGHAEADEEMHVDSDGQLFTSAQAWPVQPPGRCTVSVLSTDGGEPWRCALDKHDPAQPHMQYPGAAL
jgi:hypothetical protein